MGKKTAINRRGYKSPSIYLNSGYLDFHNIIGLNYPYTVIVGGRGIGKTFGIMDYCINNNLQFIYMRRSQSMVDQLSNNALSPIKSVADYNKLEYDTKKSGKYITRFMVSEFSNGEPVEVGIMVALSTFANLRGFDASGYDVLIFDEFIPQDTEKKIKHEGIAFLNAVETISRNRELSGGKPILTFLLTNSNTLNSEILLSLNLFDDVLNLQRTGKEIAFNKDRGLCLIRPVSKISDLKKDTTLYKFSGEGAFTDMALNNTFVMPDIPIKSHSIKGWKTLAHIPELDITIYKKGKKYYCSKHFSGVPKYTYILDLKGIQRLHRELDDFIIGVSEYRVSFQNVKIFYQLNNFITMV